MALFFFRSKMALVLLFLVLEALVCARLTGFLIKSVERLQQKVMTKRA